jgi:hypothetical protein
MRNDWSGTAAILGDSQDEPKPVFFPPNVPIHKRAKDNFGIWWLNRDSVNDSSVFWPARSNTIFELSPVVSYRPSPLHVGL